MTARDDFPYEMALGGWLAMCDEIDRLRAEVDELAGRPRRAEIRMDSEPVRIPRTQGASARFVPGSRYVSAQIEGPDGRVWRLTDAKLETSTEWQDAGR